MIQIRYTWFMSDDQNDRDVRPWDLFNASQPKSEEEIVKSRLEICKTCEYFRPKTETCKKCGCFMKLKTKLLNAKCPIGKW
jgi:uncharacterized paraquat-inducible protein A